MSWSRLLGCIIVLVSTTMAAAQPLADKVPSNALLYIGWSGSSALPSGYANSHLKAVIDASDFDYLINKTLPSAIRMLEQKNRDSAANIQLATDLLGPMFKYPSALYIAPSDQADAGDPMPTAAILCQAGDQAAQVLQKVQTLLKQAELPLPIQAANYNGLVVVRFGQSTKLDQLTQADAQTDAQRSISLAGNPQFTAILANADTNPAMVIYADVTAQLKLIDQALSHPANNQKKVQWQSMRAALDLDSIQQLIITSGFKDKNWVSSGFIKATNSQKGLLSLFPNQPVSDDLLKLVPQSASFVQATSTDLTTIRQTIETLALATGEFSSSDIANVTRELDEFLGVNVQNDLLPALSGQYVYYRDHAVGGPSWLSGVLVGRVNDPAKLQQQLAKIEATLQKATDEKKLEWVQIRIRTTQVGDTTIHYLALPAIAPSWAVDGQTFYFSLYPQVVASAIVAGKSDGPSILDNQSFAAWRKALPQPTVASLSYLDLPQLAPNGYATSLFMSRLLLGLGDLFGIDAPAILPAPLHVLLAELDISAEAVWRDADGIHFKATTPFPLANTLASGIGPVEALSFASLGTSIALPSFGRARETANRVKCASNLRQLGMAVLLYSNENRGNLPPDLGTILRAQIVGVEVFLCPSTNSERPANWAQMTPAEQDDWVNQNSDYVYLGNGKSSSFAPDSVLAYEKPADHEWDGINILFGDGHVEFVQIPTAGEMIEKTTGTNPFAN